MNVCMHAYIHVGMCAGRGQPCGRHGGGQSCGFKWFLILVRLVSKCKCMLVWVHVCMHACAQQAQPWAYPIEIWQHPTPTHPVIHVWAGGKQFRLVR